MKSKKTLWLLASLLVIFALALAACGGGATEAPPAVEVEETEPPAAEETEEMDHEMEEAVIDCKGAAAGDEVTVLTQWSGNEEEKFNAAIAPVVEACGLSVVYESTRDQAVLDTRISGGDPWDMVFWPSTTLQDNYADMLVPLEDVGAHTENYQSYWVDIGSVDGTFYTVPIKADIKTIIWYSPAVFDANGYTVPTTLDELDTLVEQMVADGNVPWSMGFESGDATGWTGSDFIQDLLLATQGPDYVNGLIDGSVSYDDAGVVAAYEMYSAWASDPVYTVGGAEGTLGTGFVDAIYKVFSDPPEAMMVKQSGFAGGEAVAQYPELVYGEDYDFFAFPGAQGMQGGADYLAVFSDSPAVQAMVAYLTSAEGAQNWASITFDISPNDAAVGHYTDAALAKKADALAAATGFTPDLGDALGTAFSSAEWTALVDVVGGASEIPAALAAAAGFQP
jgi:alpha-glucoside transport system substrate-binding protein